MKRVIIILMIVPLLLLGQFAKTGSAGAKFLNIGIGTRSIGMAKAYSAVGNDAEAVFWNPAATARSTGTSIFTNMVSYWADIGINSVAITQTVGFAGTFGFFYSGLSSGEWEMTTAENPEGINVYDSYNAFQAGVTYSRFLTDRFAFGLNLKLIREDYPDPADPRNTHDVNGFAVDVGSFYNTGFRDLTLGLAIQHFGPDVTPSGTFMDWEDGEVVIADEEFSSYPLPIVFRGGVAMTAYEDDMFTMLIAADLVHPSDNLERYSIGTELTIADILNLRTGYIFGGGVDENIGAFNFGVGVSQQMTAGGFEFGYSYSSGYYMPAVHRVSLSLGL